MTEVDVLRFMKLLPAFRGASWDRWRGVLARVTPAVRELFVVAGRGAGKSLVCALLACYYASREYPRAPGEAVYVGIFGPDRRQARLTFRYVLGLLRSHPALAALIVRQSRESVDLAGDVVIEVITASSAAPRGRSYALVIVEEAAFLPTDESANPDVELLRAVRPALARVPGSLLVVVSSPYARKGVLWGAWQKYRDAADGDVVFVQAPTIRLNPTFDARAIAKAYEEDPVAAASEYGAQFRTDVESFLSLEAVEAAIVPGRFELPPVADVTYEGFLDMAGGSGGDSAALGIAHRDARGVFVLDLVRERRPPFSPEATVDEFAADLARYRLATATSDRWAGEFPVEAFRRRRIEVRPSAKSKSDLYRELLPLVNSGRAELLDAPRLRAQFVGLERRVARGGKDSIDHPPGQHDDLANAAAGALVLAAGRAGQTAYVWFWATGRVVSAERYAQERRARELGLPLGDVGFDPSLKDPVR